MYSSNSALKQNTTCKIRNFIVLNIFCIATKKNFKIVENFDNRLTENSLKESGTHHGINTSLKGRLGMLQDCIQQVAEELSENRKNFTELMTQKESIKSTITYKSDNMQKNLKGEIEKVEKEMERHFSHQKAENSRLQQQISQLKTEKTVVQNQLLALQRRIADLELQIGDNEK